MNDAPESPDDPLIYPLVSKAQLMTETVIINPKHVNEQSLSLKEVLVEIEQRFIVDALSESKGNISKAAQNLGLRRTTLIEKMRKFRIVKENLNNTR